ncbi:WD40 repeat-like protein, partial [Mycena rebaudengoi]
QRSRVAAVSHDETCVLVVSATNSAALCNATTGETLRTFTGHSKRVCRAAFASPLMGPKRPPVATTSCDNTVRIWDVDTGSCITIFNDLGSAVNGVSWSSDATMLAITSANTVRVYETATRDFKCALDGHTNLVCDVTFSPNGQLLASASDDHTVRIWNIAKRACIAILTGPNDDVNDVEFSADGRFIAAAADDGVWIWDVNPSSVHRTSDTPRERPTFRSVAERVIMLRRSER